jgi:glycerophosphoryl diester phosphodiesterase
MLRIGHRGACGYEPENTLLSFNRALQLNVDMIELDVHVCRSGEVVVIHDEKVDRTTNGKGYVVDKALDELRALDAGKGETIPTLQEVLDLVDRKARVNTELKGTGTAKPVFELLESYVGERGWSYGDFLISSFDHRELQEFRRLSGEFRIGVLIKDIPAGFAELLARVDAYSINVFVESVSRELIDDAQRRGVKILVWTVNDTDQIERMKSLGVDGIFSNYPDRL